MNKIKDEIQNEMKTMIASKTKCMIESYGDALDETKKVLESKLGKMITDEDILKRTDMFWNIAIQRIDKETQEAKMNISRNMPPRNIPTANSAESPCAKKSRIAAEKINELEAEIVISKKELESK